MSGFRSQQHRWTKGSIQTCKKVLPLILKSRLPWWIKVEAAVHLTSNFAYLLLAFLCILLHPSRTRISTDWQQVALIDLPIFAATTLSVAVFYLCAQRELYPKDWKREILFFPFVLALGIGLCDLLWLLCGYCFGKSRVFEPSLFDAVSGRIRVCSLDLAAGTGFA
jgi:cellulose synthase/poly-beta-1,6-N-acetylglucosamine synthase-like glycosyltransferase